MKVSDLARANLYPVVMELIAEEETGSFALIKADGDDGPAATHYADRVVQRPRVAGAFERDGDPLRAVLAL
jgi:hypothetical protein